MNRNTSDALADGRDVLLMYSSTKKPPNPNAHVETDYSEVLAAVRRVLVDIDPNFGDGTGGGSGADAPPLPAALLPELGAHLKSLEDHLESFVASPHSPSIAMKRSGKRLFSPDRRSEMPDIDEERDSAELGPHGGKGEAEGEAEGEAQLGDTKSNAQLRRRLDILARELVTVRESESRLESELVAAAAEKENRRVSLVAVGTSDDHELRRFLSGVPPTGTPGVGGVTSSFCLSSLSRSSAIFFSRSRIRGKSFMQ